MTIDRRKYLWRIKRLEIKSWLKYLMIEGKHVVDYVLGELTSGTEITINNTVEKTFYKFDIKGNSVQNGTPSPTNEVPIYSAGDDIQLFDKNSNFYKRFSDSTYTVSGNDIHFKNITANANEFFWVNIPVTIGKDITISYGNIEEAVANQNNKMQFFFSSTAITTYSSNWSLTDISKTDKYKTATATAQYLVVIFRTGNNQEYTISNVKIAESTTATPYSSYGMGTISEKIVNKNKLDVNVIQERTTNGITMTLNGQTINIKGTATGNANFYMKTGKSIILPAGTYYIQRTSLLNIGTLKLTSGSTTILATGNTDTTFTLNSETVIDGLTLQVSSSVGTIDKDVVLMICSSSLSTEYTPYQEQTYTIPVQQPMRSIGTVRDEFINVNEELKERHNIAYIESYNGETITTDYISTTGGLDIGASVQYILETPVDLPCTAEQIVILENLPTSYNEQTNIYSLDVTPAYLEVQAYVKKEEVLEND